MKKINIAEILKYCPKGMELDCTMIDNIVFEKLDFISSHHPIIIKRTDSNKTIHLTKYGQYSDEEDYKCVIFPKGKTTWEGFVPPVQFKDGDIITNPLGTCIFKGEGKIKGTVDYYCGIISGDSDCFSVKDNKCRPDGHYGDIVNYRLATEEEKQKLFDAIKANGYKWNEATKTLEKLIEPKFKVGDVIQDIDSYKAKITKVDTEDECYGYESMITKGIGSIMFSKQDEWELVFPKFDISTLESFDKVLVRDNNTQEWRISLFSHYNNLTVYKYSCINGCGYAQCVPYEGNEHLLGTTNDCEEFYKNWT